MVVWNTGEPPPEIEKGFGEGVPELEEIVQAEIYTFYEVIIEEYPSEYVPMDDYLQRELERQEQEKLSEMLPKRIP